MGILVGFFIIYAVIELINYITKKYGFNSLTYSRHADKHSCFVDEDIVLSVEVSNKKLWPVPYLETMEKLPKEFEYKIMDNVFSTVEYNYHRSVMMLMSFQKITRKYIMHCSKRGRYYFYVVNLTIGDAFGLQTYTKEMDSKVELLVFPKIKPLSSLMIDYKNPQGDISIRRWIMEDPIIISGIREYTSSDPFNKIHWVSSARRGELMVKNFDFTSNQRVMILLNVETAKPFWIKIDENMIEKVIDIAASVSSELLEAGMGVGLYTNAALSGYKYSEGNYIEPGCAPGQMTRILELLARVSYNIHQDFEELLAKAFNKASYEYYSSEFHYIIVTPMVTPECADIINTMLGKHFRITLISIDMKNTDKIRGSARIFKAAGGEEKLEAV